MDNMYKPEVRTCNIVATAAHTAGTPLIEGGLFVIPITDADIGDTNVCYFRGAFGLVKDTGTAALAGATAYFDSTAEEVEASDDANNRKIGSFQEAAVSGATSCYVALDGVAFGDGNVDLESKVNISDLAAVTVGKGATLVGLYDTAGHYTAVTAEAALAEVKVIADAAAPTADLASVSNGKGGSLVGFEDAAEATAETTLEGAVAELYVINDIWATAEILVTAGASTATSGADTAFVGKTIVGCVCAGKADKVVESVTVATNGAVTLTLQAATTSNATYNVLGKAD